MFFQFNNFTGRLTGSTHMHPYFPVSAQPLERREPPKIIFHSKNEQMARVAPPVRHASQNLIPGTNTPYGPVPENLRRKMEHFQKRDGVPVHLKGGPMDRALFGLTVALCAIGLFESFRFYYIMSTPRK
ncbi:cytochrome c oxidase subunit 7A-related protein, mitochondrial-like [Schistocerca americana]|uniref:cytochrome c oxidase subunit 7A-related protein, mitochondrial-like n=1 Tax=Schistocerca americana TaxID=7009 RepID=UPI001F502BC6|nr:cytochrome c oxidase subunit 7A-related protein, mitochondrial-like [Schistocerca americana]XP_047119773.1 cytochrome c oxidase subunit 7A-related protein, mitochondrial-like [Schistocerca piceifrons]